MNDQTFDALQELADNAYDKFADLHEKGQFAEIEAALRKIAENVAERYSFSLSLKLEVFDSERGKSMQMLDTGLACSASQTPYLATGGSTVQKYVVNGTMARVPHDYFRRLKCEARDPKHCGN